MPIQSKADYFLYLQADCENSYGPPPRGWRRLFKSDIKRWTELLRKLEYTINCRRDPIGWLWRLYLQWRFRRWSRLLGFSIPPNTCGPGLSIPHRGTIVINGDVRIGRNCRIHVCVNIGAHKEKAPVIGDNVYIGPGAKLFGGIAIGDNAVIGANTVVNRDIPPNVTVGGIPAKVIAEQGSEDMIAALRKQSSQALMEPNK